MVGRLGMIGLPLVLGNERALFRSVVQLPTRALRLSADAFRSAMGEHPGFRSLLLRYVQFRLLVEAQAVLCNTEHKLEQRLAQWLLKVCDCIDESDAKISVSHECLSRMLLVRRASITTILASMEQRGILRTSRCRIHIIDTKALKRLSCSCFQILQDEFQRLIPTPRREYLEHDKQRSVTRNSCVRVSQRL